MVVNVGKRFLKVIIFIVIISISLYCERKNSRNDVISKASEEYLSKVDGTKPGELDSLLISGVASYGDENKALAIRYFEKAYELGDVRGAVKLYELYNTEKDMEKIKEWEVKAAEMGDAEVQNSLAIRLENEKNYKAAENWYLKAIKNGSIYAKRNLGILYENQGKIKEAEKAYLQAIKENDEGSMNNLGGIYKEQGKYTEAEDLYLKAITNGDKNALYNLGDLYDNYLNNKEKAIYWYKQAEKNGIKEAKIKLKELKNVR